MAATTHATLEAAQAAVKGPKDKVYAVTLDGTTTYAVASNQVKAGHAAYLAAGGTVTQNGKPAVVTEADLLTALAALTPEARKALLKQVK